MNGNIATLASSQSACLFPITQFFAVIRMTCKGGSRNNITMPRLNRRGIVMVLQASAGLSGVAVSNCV